MDQSAVSIISLGCAKNLVDTEQLLGAFVERGWLVAGQPTDADVLLVNTCGFIDEARDESAGVIEQALELKAAGRITAVAVVGCMVQLMRDALRRRFAAVDAWVGLTEPGAVVDACEQALRSTDQAVSAAPESTARPGGGPRLRVTPKHLAYLRISEGCNNRCAYCQIPEIRGPFRSRPADAVLDEARSLVADGARELILIGQDTTSYGVDLHGEPRLPALLRDLRAVDRVEWIRLLYTHPAHWTDELVAVLAEGRPVLPYVDVPIQHASDPILRAMGRGIDAAGIRDLIGRLREAVPDAALRTSVIVGFPGEGEAEFGELLDFLREVRFERLGAFAYSREAGTPAAELDGHVPAEAKQERLAAVMELGQEIATEQSDALVGQELDVVVDRKDFDGEWTGRTVRDAPDVDGAIKFENTDLEPGLFGRALVTDAYGYDLTGRMTMKEEGAVEDVSLQPL